MGVTTVYEKLLSVKATCRIENKDYMEIVFDDDNAYFTLNVEGEHAEVSLRRDDVREIVKALQAWTGPTE